MSQDAPNAKRRYRAPMRAEKAATTRRAILAAAGELFTGQGYGATSIADVARLAGVNVDTVYATIGRKPMLLRALVESAISGADDPIPVHERDYVLRIRAAPDARGKLAIYAQAIGAIQQRLAPIFLCLSEAAKRDPDCAALWREIGERRAHNMREFAADLRRTGELREDLSDDEVADIVWSLNGAEFYTLLVHERRWTPERFAAWLADAWVRLLLAGRPGA